MSKEEIAVSYSWDKENMEEFLRDYFEDDSIELTEKQWSSVARAIEWNANKYFEGLFEDMCTEWAKGEFNEEPEKNLEIVLGL